MKEAIMMVFAVKSWANSNDNMAHDSPYLISAENVLFYAHRLQEPPPPTPFYSIIP